MKIDEAIKYLDDYMNERVDPDWDVLVDAMGLGIEALKRVRDYKKAHIGLHYTPMSGETEEIQKAHGLPLGGITIKLPGETEE
jgi:hypothetical protein